MLPFCIKLMISLTKVILPDFPPALTRFCTYNQGKKTTTKKQVNDCFLGLSLPSDVHEWGRTPVFFPLALRWKPVKRRTLLRNQKKTDVSEGETRRNEVDEATRIWGVRCTPHPSNPTPAHRSTREILEVFISRKGRRRRRRQKNNKTE